MEIASLKAAACVHANTSTAAFPTGNAVLWVIGGGATPSRSKRRPASAVVQLLGPCPSLTLAWADDSYYLTLRQPERLGCRSDRGVTLARDYRATVFPSLRGEKTANEVVAQFADVRGHGVRH